MNKKLILPIAFTAVAVSAISLTTTMIAPHNNNASLAEENNIVISIIGEAESELVPDSAVISLSIENIDNEISVAKDKTFESFDNVVKILTDNGVNKQNIIVENYTSYPNYDYSSGRTLIGYRSNLSMTYKVDSLEKVRSTIDAVTNSTTVNVQNVNYQISNESEVYNTTLQKALESAKKKAETLLNKTDLTLTNIEEETVYYSSSLYRSYNSGMEKQDMIGKVKIKARVKAEFCWNPLEIC